MLNKISFYLNRINKNKTEEIKLIRNINFRAGQKNVLISYITTPFYTDFNTSSYRSSAIELLEIINIFIKLGYTIDVVQCNEVEVYRKKLIGVE